MARSGLEVQRAAINALFLRELKTRFGKYRLGYFWAILEPTAHLSVLLVIFDFIMKRTLPDISFSVFLLNGIIPFFIFNNIARRSIGAIESNQGLFNYRPVKPIDTIISRAILEVIIYIVVYAVLMIIAGLSGEAIYIDNVIMLLSCWIMLFLLSGGIGIIFMVIGKTFPETEKFFPVILKPLYFISCVMFPLHSIPEKYWSYITWNPLVHVVELSRNAVVPGYESQGVSLGYLVICTLSVLFVGLALYRAREGAMLTS